MGKPVITFSRHHSYNFLDHVFTVKDADDTKDILSYICKNKFLTKNLFMTVQRFSNYINLSFLFEKFRNNLS